MRLQSSLTASTSQLKQLQSELGARDAEVAQLRAEAEATRKRLHLLQASQASPGGALMHNRATFVCQS